ncbi:AraC family transcriptional regulator [Pedobacter cryoconitis]|uniref:Helix-turn-helix protein n=1 Tax=Pedobacter cryoconitis TaxID=188932 RepID=A0A327RZT1_9SPHI|nr:AraC family transcriptional regulator [Pedobacter cryoconitis]RAJ22390.1 helix-turn-helix protein [Pedobacter cryoconitis]
MDIVREITPLTQNDCFTMFSRIKKEFDFPLHNHDEMELNLILNAAGAKRIVGDHIDVITDYELVFIGSNLSHGWFNHNCQNREIQEVTIQFHKDLLDDRFLKRNQLTQIRKMFEGAKRGVLFSTETIKDIAPRLIALNKMNSFDSILELFSIFHELSNSREMRMLSDSTFNLEQFNYNSRRIEKVFEFMNANFSRQITLMEVSKVANMPEASFSRFIKKRTGYTFIESLTEIRLGHVSRMLIDTTHSVAEIAYKCGFNNMANFNRTFKSKKGCTPKEFKADYNVNIIFI